MSKFTLPAIRDRLADWRSSYALLTSLAATVPLRRDMLTLLTFVRENKVIGTSSTGNMPLKALKEVAPLISNPPTLEIEIGARTYHRRSEREVWPIYFLHILAEVGRLIQTGPSRRWKVTSQGEQFLKTEPDIQLAFALAVWWHRVNWLVAYPFAGMGDDLPHGFSSAALSLLRSIPTGTEMSFSEYATELIDGTGLEWGAPDSSIADDALRVSIERMITDVLAKFGALECRYRSEPLLGVKIDKLTTIQITPLGRALLEAIALVDE